MFSGSGSSLNLNPHVHVLMLDGVYVDGEEAPVFVAAPPLSDQAVQQIVETSARRIIRLSTKRGLLDDTAADPLAAEEPVLAVLTAASVRGLIATGARSGQRLRRALKDPATGVRTAPLCFASRGFSLHAARRIAGRDRRGLERLCRYVARPALASGRLRPSPGVGGPAGPGVFLRPQRMRSLWRAPEDHRRPDRSDLDPDLSGRGRVAGGAPAEGPAAAAVRVRGLTSPHSLPAP